MTYLLPVYRRLLLILGLLFCLSVVESNAQGQGVLLGLRVSEPLTRPLPYYTTAADSLSRTTYRTLLLTKTDSSIALAGDVPELLIPRGNGFWRGGTKRSVYNSWVEDFIWSAPEGMPRNFAGIQSFNGEYCEGHRVYDIQFISARHIAYEQRSSGYCEGATHPWFFNTCDPT